MTDVLIHWVSAGGLVAVFVLMVAESCGVPFPSEVTMPLAGALAAAGQLNAFAATVAGALGNLVGSLIAYGLAAGFGEPLLLGPGRRIGIRAHHVEMADRWFRRHGLAAVFFGRLLPVVRTYISFPAGLARVRLDLFALLTFAGALPWCAALVGGGYAVGANWDHIAKPIETLSLVIAAVVAAGLVAWFIRGRGDGRGEPADPGR